VTGKRRYVAIGFVLLAVALTLVWLGTTQNNSVWPVRNTLQYHALSWWWDLVGQPAMDETGTLQGRVTDSEGQPIAGARVLVARWDGVTYSALSEKTGNYRIGNIPAGTYRPVAGAPGYGSATLGGPAGVKITADTATVTDVVLPTGVSRAIIPGRNLAIGEPTRLNCTIPLETSAARRQITFDDAGQPNQLTFFYTPITATTSSRLPILLAVYPGPADGWECASLPLAEAGYAVLATGPAYSFDLERDIDELERLLEFARQGRFPGADGSRLAALGGSYSGLHVQRLLQRGQPFRAALLLGPPTDLFDMRRRLEQGTYIPPFDLDKALVALGLPDREPRRYWRYSGAYHVRADFPPLMIMHSRSDEIVPYQQSELLATNLAEVGATYDTYFFDGASHYLLSETGGAPELYQITLDFLAQHLK
jgi:hypothetical protein